MEHIFPPPFCFLYCNTRWAWGKDGKKFAIPLDETFAAWYYNTCADQGDHTKCASGGIGRLAGFRCQCSLRACGFDSRLAHQDDPNQILLRGWVRIIFFSRFPQSQGTNFQFLHGNPMIWAESRRNQPQIARSSVLLDWLPRIMAG